MDLQPLALAAAGLNLIAALVGFPVLWSQVQDLRAEVRDLRGQVRQLELSTARAGHNPGALPDGPR